MAEEVVFNLNIQSNGEKTIGNLKTQLKQATQEAALMSEKFGATSTAAINAAKKAAILKDEIGDINQTIKALSPDEKFNSIANLAQGIAGGFAAAQGALALFGTESEEVEKAMLKVQAALALSQGLNSVIGLKDGIQNLGIVIKSTTAFQKAMAVATAAYNAVVGVTTGGLKLFRLALIGTGIGAIVVGIGLLIENFDKLKKIIDDNSDSLKKIAEFILRFGNPIGLVITGLQMLGKKFQFIQNIIDIVAEQFGLLWESIQEALISLGVLDSEQENMAEAELERAEEKIDSIEKVMNARKREIELAKAQGKTEDELRAMEINSLDERLKTYQEFVSAKMALGEELSKEEQEKLDEFTHEHQLAILDDQRLDSAAAEEKKKKDDEAAKKLAEQRKKQADERRKAAEDEAKRLAEVEKQLTDLKIEAMNEGLEKELAQSRINTQRKLEAIKGESEIENQLRIQIINDQKTKESEIINKFSEEEAVAEMERALKEGEDKEIALEAELVRMELEGQALTDKKIEIENARFLNEISNKELTDAEIELAEANHQKNLTDITKAEEEERLRIKQQIEDAKFAIAQNSLNSISSIGNLLIKDAKKLETFNKITAGAQLAIDTAKSISSTIAGASAAAAAGGPAAPFLLAGYITSGIATVVGAFAQAKKLLGSSSGSATPTLGGGTGGGATPVQAPIVETGNNLTSQVNLNQTKGSKQSVIKAIVVESDMTDTQGRVKGIKESAEF
jgi:hypothetical protein